MTVTIEEVMDYLNSVDLDFTNLTAHNFEDKIVFPLEMKDKYHFDYEIGASKGVLIFYNCDYVIKIPLAGEEDKIIDTIHEDEQEPYMYKEIGFKKFENAGGDINAWNYCEAEGHIYHAAKRENLDKFFVKTIYYGNIKNYPIYIQKLVDVVGDVDSYFYCSDEDREEVRNICSSEGFICFCETWMSDVIKFYGKESFEKLNNFLSDYGINDMHDGNIGYYKGAPIIFDYARLV